MQRTSIVKLETGRFSALLVTFTSSFRVTAKQVYRFGVQIRASFSRIFGNLWSFEENKVGW